MTAWYVFDTLTGKILSEFEPESGSWSVKTNEAEQVQVTVPLTDPILASLNWVTLAAPWKSSLAVEEHGRFYGGPILPHSFSTDDLKLNLTARGLWSYFDRRYVLPPAAESTKLVTPFGTPNNSLNTSISGFDLGTIGKKIVQQACSWPGANLPIVYQADRVSFHSRVYAALDFKSVGSALTDLCAVEGGPDMRFQLQKKDSTHFEWIFETGTQAKPRLESILKPFWDLAALKASGSSLEVGTDPSQMADISWSTGGRNDDRVLVSQKKSNVLRNAGYPLLEVLSQSHADVTVQSTLDSYAAETLRTAYTPAQFWSFKAAANMSPYLYEYSVGDLCTLRVEGIPYIPDNYYERRIVALSGDEDGLFISITLGEVYDG